MICQICKENAATVHYTELSNNRMVEIHLCEKCALEKGVSFKPHLLLADLMAGLVQLEKSPSLQKGKKCSNCGLTYSGFREAGRLGCAKCYETFKESLGALLKNIHGSSAHVGKVSAAAEHEVDGTIILKKLRERLQKLVEREQFEEAARVRDEIRKLER